MEKLEFMYARRGQFVRLLYLLVALVVWPWARRRYCDAVVVLCYHGVSTAQRAAFAAQMRRIRGRVVASTQLEVSPSVAQARPRVCITFDDAFENLLANAVPVLRACGAPATVFAVSENLGGPPRWAIDPEHPEAREPIMTAAMLREAASAKAFHVGSHTATHADLATLSNGDLLTELKGSRGALGALLESEVKALALPFGSGGERAVQSAMTAGYEQVFTLEERCVRPSDRGVHGRFLMSPDTWMIEFVLTCDGAYAWLFGLRRLVRSLRPGRAAPPSSKKTQPA